MYTPSKGTRPNHLHTEPEKHHQKCVCQICTCGKHSCPQKSLKFEGETTHNHDYKPYDIIPDNSQRMVYNPEQKHYDPSLIQSTYHSAYTPHQIEKQGNPHMAYNYQPNRGKFQDETEYKKNYVPSQITVDRPAQLVRYAPNNAKFQGSTTYNREYSPKHVNQPSSYRLYEYQPNKMPFQGKTTYESEYKPHKIESVRPDTTSKYQARNAPFVGQSRYSQEYVGYQINAPQVCPTELLPSRPQRCSPGKEHLHFSATRNRWE